jgi:ankyrin repeat protein
MNSNWGTQSVTHFGFATNKPAGATAQDLSHACEVGDAKALSDLLELADTDVNRVQRGTGGWTALMDAVVGNQVECAALLLAREEVQPNVAREDNGITALMMTCHYGYATVLLLLLLLLVRDGAAAAAAAAAASIAPSTSTDQPTHSPPSGTRSCAA